jgi:hypothetical protein
MGKLLFEDDNGNSHEVKISSISAKSMSKDDIVIASYEIGDMPYKNANALLMNLKNMLEAVFMKGTRVLVTATRNGKKDVDISIIKPKKE